MRLYFILFYCSIFFSLSGMQENGPFELSTYAITMHSDTISDLKQFGIEQFFNNKTKINEPKILIIDSKNECLSIDSDYIYNYYNLQKPKPQQATLDSITLNQQDKVFYFINPTTYDNSAEITIKFLANKNVKPHYFILKQSIHLAIKEKIDHIYLQTDTQKFVQLQKIKKQNTLKNRFKQNLYSLKNHVKQDFYSLIKQFKQNLYLCITSFGNKITSIPILCLIIKLTDHPDFPWPSLQPFILDGFPFIILLKMLLE